MTRKHFVKVSDVLRETKANKELCEHFARMCRSENNNFNKQRFMAACGHPE